MPGSHPRSQPPHPPHPPPSRGGGERHPPPPSLAQLHDLTQRRIRCYAAPGRTRHASPLRPADPQRRLRPALGHRGHRCRRPQRPHRRARRPADATADETIDANGLHVLPGPDRPARPPARPRRQNRGNHPDRHQGRGARRPRRGVRHAEHRALDRRRGQTRLETALRRAGRLVRHGPVYRRHQDQHPANSPAWNSAKAFAASRSSPAVPPAI